jgi:LacI family gluconate utilization system Gnt-I transcriptional repressor
MSVAPQSGKDRPAPLAANCFTGWVSQKNPVRITDYASTRGGRRHIVGNCIDFLICLFSQTGFRPSVGGQVDKKTPPKGAGQRVRVEDVARVAGVSPITVSRALSTPEKVREDTRQRIADAVAATGYVVNPIASSLRSGRSTIVTVFVSNLVNPHFVAAMQGTIDAFEGSRYRLMFAQTGYSEGVEAEAVGALLPFRPAGLMFTSVLHSEPTREALRELDVPVVEMWGYRPDPIDMLVGSPAFDAGFLMGDHLGAGGYRHIAYSGHVADRGALRLDGFRAGLAKWNATLDHVHPMEGTRHIRDGITALDQILAHYPECDAMFFGSDILATGALIRARERGLDVPGRLGIAGVGDLEAASYMRPAVTTINLSAYQMGYDGARMLLARLDGGRRGDPILMHPPRLVVRDSTRRI